MLETFSRRALAAAAAMAFVAGCAGNTAGSGQVPWMVPQSVQRGARVLPGPIVSGPIVLSAYPHPSNLPHVWPTHHHHKPQILFVSDQSNNQVLMYNPKVANPSPKGSITTGVDVPGGLAVDNHSALYVVNAGNNTITVYPFGKTSPSLTINSGLSSPYGITVDSKGNVFASNLGNNTIVGYKAGQTTPFETISFNSEGQAVGVGSDANDNIWVVCDTTNAVFEIPAGSSTPQNANLTNLSGPIGISFGQNDQMFVSNIAAPNVEVYNYGSKSPSVTITNGISSPTLNALTHSDYLFQTNQDTNVVGYLKGATSPFSTITGNSNPLGVASAPLVTK